MALWSALIVLLGSSLGLVTGEPESRVTPGPARFDGAVQVSVSDQTTPAESEVQGEATSDGAAPILSSPGVDTFGGDEPPQEGCLSPEVWVKAYGQPNVTDVINRAIVTSDGRIVATGYRQNTSKDVLIAWFSTTGQVVRKTVFDGGADEEGRDIVETSDGDLVVVGYTRSKGDGADFMICRVAGDGSPWRWTRYWGNGNDQDEELFAIIKASDQTLWAAGFTDSFAPVGRRKVVIAQVGPEGDSLACCRVGKLTDAWHLTGYAMAEVFNTHGFCVAGTIVDNDLLGFGQQILLAKFSDTPTFLWADRIGSSNTEASANAIVRTSDAGLALAGNLSYWDGIYEDDGSFVLKMDANAQLSWARWHVGFFIYESPDIYDMIETRDGALLALGQSWDYFSPLQETVWLAKLSFGGAELWSRGFDATPYAVARTVAEEATGSLIVAGDIVGSDEYSDVLLGRCTSSGATCRASAAGPGFGGWSAEQNEIPLLSSLPFTVELSPWSHGFLFVPWSTTTICTANVISVCPDGTCDFLTIQDAIDAAADGEIIELRPATYTGPRNRNLDFGGKCLIMRSQNCDPTQCTIDCQYAGRGFWFHNGEYPEAAVEGITICHGQAPGSPSSGGGIYCEGATPTIRNCKILDCAADSGGGICVEGSSPTISNCQIRDCSADWGGGICVNGGSPAISNCLIAECSSASGAGVAIGFGSATITGCQVTHNFGTGIECYLAGVSTIHSCTVADNGPGTFAGGLSFFECSGNTEVTNSIVWGNEGGQVACAGPEGGPHGCADMSCCDVQGGWSGTNNIDMDPLFCDPQAGDYRLFSNSPCAPAFQPVCGLIGALGVGCTPPHACCPTSPFGNGAGNWTIPPGETRTLSNDSDYHDVTVGDGSTLDTRGHRLRVCGTLLNWGTITDTSGSAGGTGGAGGKGANPKGGGVDPTGCGRTGTSCTPGSPGGTGPGRAGDGGCGGGGGGGAWSDFALCVRDADGGTGGAGGHGGRGGGNVLVYAYRLDNHGVIHADGELGGSGLAAPPGDEGDPDDPNGYEHCGAEYYPYICLAFRRDIAGGGGGGGQGGDGGDGGTVNVYYGMLLNSGTLRANRGLGGLGGSGGSGGGCLSFGVTDGGHQNGCSGCDAHGQGGRGAHEQGDCATAGQAGASGANGAMGQWQLQAVVFPDCNENSVPDQCDIYLGTSLDCQPNDTPDECDIEDGSSSDCQPNRIPDECDIATATSQDCQPNGIPDECDIAVAPLSALSDAAAGDAFGQAVAIDGDTMVVGAPLDDSARGTDAGAAYVLVRGEDGWTLQDMLIASDGQAGDQFGSAVAIDSDTIVVGAPFDDNAGGTDAGSAYVFVRAGTTWTQQPAKPVPLDPASGQRFGCAVALREDLAVVGAAYDAQLGTRTGAAYVFRHNGSAWPQESKLLPNTGSDRKDWGYFGSSVAIDGTAIAVGAEGQYVGSERKGAAYVFRGNGSAWSQEARLLAPDGAAGDDFGLDVDIKGGVLVVGSFWDDDQGADSGSAYIFAQVAGVWTFLDKLTAFDGAAGDQFGTAVAIHGKTLVVGAPLDDNAGGIDAGAASVFVRVADVWTFKAKLIAPDGAAGDNFGVSVARDSGTVVVGAYHDDLDAGTDAGSAYTYSGVGSDDCNANGVPDECDIADGTSLDCNFNGIPDECEGGSCALMGDLNGSGLVNGLDIQVFVNCALGYESSPCVCACGDFTGDGVVREADIPGFIQVLLFGPWGSSCESNADCTCAEACYCHKASCEDITGECWWRPEACPEVFYPVCGCDGYTYTHPCEAARAGVDVRHTGACP